MPIMPTPQPTPQGADAALTFGGSTEAVPGAPQIPSFDVPSAQPTFKPDTVGDNSLETDLQAALANLDKTGVGELKPEAARTKRQVPVVSQTVPGYPSLDFNAAWLEPWRYNEARMTKFQRRLAVAGYLPISEGGEIGVDQIGAYDTKTQAAMSQLLLDSQNSGYSPKALLDYRVQLAAGKHPKELKKPGPQDDATWRSSMEDAYIEAWHGKQKAPPGYLDQFVGFNPQELIAYERAKATYQESQVGQDQQQQLLGLLKDMFSGGGQ